MSLKKYILEDLESGELKRGDWLQLVFGQSQKTVGTVLDANEDLILLQTQKGKSRILLDCIISYEVLEAEEGGGKPAAELSGEKQPPLQPTVPYAPVREHSEEERMVADIKRSRGPSPEEVADLNGIRAAVKSVDDRDAQRTVGSILDAVSFAEKQHNTGREYKFRDILARTRAAIHNFPAERVLFRRLLGAVYLLQSDFGEAEQAFYEAGYYRGAAYSARWGNHLGKLGEYLDRYLANEKNWEPDLVQQYAEQAVSRRDASALCMCLRREDALEEERRHALIDAAVYLSHLGGFPIRWSDPRNIYAQDNLRAVLESIPSDWKTDGEDLTSDPAGEADAASAEDWQYGSVKFYNERCFGFIEEKETDANGFVRSKGTDCYFHIKQVLDEDIDLRQALYCGQWKGLDVRYLNGIGQKGRSASAVELTERGRAEACKRLSRFRMHGTPTHDKLQGRIVHYEHDIAWGCIERDGKTYGFYLKAVMDPFLRAYLNDTFDFGERDQRMVTFEVETARNGKEVATHVASAEPFSDEERQSWLHHRNVTKEEERAWEARQAASSAEDEDMEEDPGNYLAPDEDPYANLTFEALEPWSAAPPAAASPQSAVLPAASPAAPVSPVTETTEDEDYWKAHYEANQGDRNRAENLYLQSLRKHGARAESALADLITLYLREENRVQDAFSVLDQYGNLLTPEKRMNLELQICQKGKDPETRKRLIRVLGDAIENTTKISTRFHYLMLRGNALRQIGEYSMALQVYQQWRDLYNSELQAMGSRAVAQYANRFHIIKRGEACCYYFLGEMEKARALAQELRRVNAGDETALAILNGTLVENMAGFDESEEDGDASRPEDDEPIDRSLSEYVRDRIQDLDAGSVTKSKYLRDGNFEGTPEEAERLLENTLPKTGTAPKVRGDRLLSAAKIISQVWENYPEDWVKLNRLKLGRKLIKTYAGRSMASYGNYFMSTPAMVITAASSAQSDAARFLYLESMSLLSNRDEQDYANSFVHYISSYFLGQEEMQEQVRMNGLTNWSFAQGLNMLESESTPLSEDEFAYGMIQLHSALCGDSQSPKDARSQDSMQRLRNRLEKALSKSSRQKVLRERLHRMGIPSTDFRTELTVAMAKCRDQEQSLNAALSGVANQPLGGLAQRERLSALQDEGWAMWMTCTDWERLKTSVHLMAQLNQTENMQDFERREGILSNVIDQIVRLCAEINEWPTRISYSILRPQLLRIRETLAMERGKLYQLVPHITLELSNEIAPYTDGEQENVVCVHMNVSNSPGVQMADSIQLRVTCPDDVKLLPGKEVRTPSTQDGTGDEIHVPGVPSGKSQEIILRFLAGRSTWDQGSFAISVQGQYSYKRDAQNIEQGQIEPVNFAIVLRKSAESIVNVFEGLDRSEMTEEKMFFGRDEMISSIVNMMRLPAGRFNYGHGLVLYGQTRAGKSSILFHLKRQVRQQYGDRVMIVDLGNIHEVANTGNLFTNLLYRIVGELDNQPREVLRSLEGQIGGSLIDYQERILDEPQNAEALFSNLMRKLDRLLEEPEDGEPMMLLMMIDEFSCIHEEIKKGNLPPRFMFFWKALLENHAIFTVVAGQDDMPQFIRENQNAFMAMQLKKVTYLEESAAKRLISEPIRFADGTSRYIDSALDEMYHLTAGSAFLILLLSAKLVEYLNKRGADKVTKAIIDSFLRDWVFSSNSFLNTSIFEAQLQDRSDSTLESANIQVLTAIARASRVPGGRAGYEAVRKLCPEISAERMDSLLARLEERDVLTCEIEQTGRYYRIEVELLASWLRYQNRDKE